MYVTLRFNKERQETKAIYLPKLPTSVYVVVVVVGRMFCGRSFILNIYAINIFKFYKKISYSLHKKNKNKDLYFSLYVFLDPLFIILLTIV